MSEKSRFGGVIHIVKKSGISKHLTLIDAQLITIPRVLADVDTKEHKLLAIRACLEVIRDVAQQAIESLDKDKTI